MAKRRREETRREEERRGEERTGKDRRRAGAGHGDRAEKPKPGPDCWNIHGHLGVRDQCFSIVGLYCVRNGYCDHGHPVQSNRNSAPRGSGGLAMAVPKPWAWSVMAMIFAMTLACIAVVWALALSIAALVAIIMRCIALRPAKFIIPNNTAWPWSEQRSLQNPHAHRTSHETHVFL